MDGDYGPDQVSPYAVFPSLMSSDVGKNASQISSSRRMKTFVVDGTQDLYFLLGHRQHE